VVRLRQMLLLSNLKLLQAVANFLQCSFYWAAMATGC
jgi:hypothetical protein